MQADPITVTTAIVLLIQSIGGEDAPKMEEKKGKKKKKPSRAPVLLSLRAECVGMLSASFHWPPLNGVLFFFFFLLFHTVVSFRARGQASKTAPRAGLAPINVLAHNGARQARL